MGNCSNCGKKLNKSDKFCTNCGFEQEELEENEKKAEITEVNDITERKTVYEGKIHKCPNCGEVLKSLTAICPSCGYEVNSQNISSSLKKFIDSIDGYDKAIANEKELNKTGWKAWNTGIKILWIILNILTSFIPLVVYLVFPLIKPFLFPKNVSSLSANEKKKASLIENYTFPNEREATIEAMIFIKTKIDFLAKEKFNKKTLFWSNLWVTKAEQLNNKANIILNGDKIVQSTYDEIKANKNKIDKSVRVRAIIGTIIILIFTVFVLINGSIFNSITNIMSGNGNLSQEKIEWLETGLSTKIPKYDSDKGEIVTNTDTELWLRFEDVSYNEFEEYVSACKEKGYVLEAKKDTDGYEAYNSEGYYLNIYLWGNTGSFDIKLNAPLTSDPNFKWPDDKLGSMLPKFDEKTGIVETDTEETLKLIIPNIKEKEIHSYILKCEKKGYTIDSKKDDTSFRGFNKEGYELEISYDNQMKSMTIELDTPMEFSKILWPSTGPARLIPKPPSKMGNISIDFDDSFSVYISGMTIDDFNDYVDKCIKKGFEKDYRYETRFSGYKGDDIDLSVEYYGFNIVYISISN